MQQIVVMSFVQDAIQNTISVVIGSCKSRPRFPDAWVKISLPDLLTTTVTMPGRELAFLESVPAQVWSNLALRDAVADKGRGAIVDFYAKRSSNGRR